MSFIDQARGIIVERGYEYYKSDKVSNITQLNDHEYEGYVEGSNDQPYYTTIDVIHPRKSTCTCPYGEGQKICKHQIALYFSVFPEEADEYEQWLESNYYEDEEESWNDDGWYDDDDSYGFNDYSRFEKPLFFDQVLADFIHNLDENEAKNLLKEQLLNNPELTYNRYLKCNYQKLLKEHNKEWEFIEKLKQKLDDAIPQYNYEEVDYNKKILTNYDKKRITELFNQEYQDIFDSILLNPKIGVFKEARWIVSLYRTCHRKLDHYYKELEDHLVYLKKAWITNTIPKSNVLILMYMINPGTQQELVHSLLKNSKYFDYIDYVLNDVDNEILFHAVIKELDHYSYKYRKSAPQLLDCFLIHSDHTNQNQVYLAALYHFLDSKDVDYLDIMVRFYDQKFIIREIELKTKDVYTLIRLYAHFNMNDKLWNILNQDHNQRLLIYHVDVLKEHYSKELYQYFYHQFYTILKQGKKREIYHDACVYVKGIKQLINGDKLVDNLINELNHSTYAKCIALFDEINKIK